MKKYFLSIFLTLGLSSCVSYIVGKMTETELRYPTNGQIRTCSVGEKLIHDMVHDIYGTQSKYGKEVLFKGRSGETITVTVTKWSGKSSLPPESVVDLQYTIPANADSTEIKIQDYTIRIQSMQGNSLTFRMVSGIPEKKESK